MFDNLYILNLPAINLYNINLLYPETNYERVVKGTPSPSLGICEKRLDERDTSNEVDRVLRVRGRMEEILNGRY